MIWGNITWRRSLSLLHNIIVSLLRDNCSLSTKTVYNYCYKNSYSRATTRLQPNEYSKNNRIYHIFTSQNLIDHRNLCDTVVFIGHVNLYEPKDLMRIKSSVYVRYYNVYLRILSARRTGYNSFIFSFIIVICARALWKSNVTQFRFTTEGSYIGKSVIEGKQR